MVLCEHQAGRGVDTENVTLGRPGAQKVHASLGNPFFFADFLAACLVGHDKPLTRSAIKRSGNPRSCGRKYIFSPCTTLQFTPHFMALRSHFTANTPPTPQNQSDMTIKEDGAHPLWSHLLKFSSIILLNRDGFQA